jgi:hypothetical protein
MEESILTSTKKILGITDDYTAFDHDIIVHINSTFSILTQLGIGPDVGFSIEDKTTEWGDYPVSEVVRNMVRTYVFLKVRTLFDPPDTGYLVTAAKDQLSEYEVRLNLLREVEIL